MFFLTVSIFGLVLVFLANYIGKRHGMYKKGHENFWFDKIMHFFGGFFVAMFWLAFVHNFLLVVLLAFFVGVLWEIAEFLYGLWVFQKKNTTEKFTEPQDTMEDLFYNMLGAVVFLMIFVRVSL